MVKPQLSEVAMYALSHPSSIREIMNVVTDYRQHPEKYPRKLIYLGGGWPQDPPPKILWESMREVVSNKNLLNEYARYGATRGQPELISGIVNYEREVFNRTVEYESIIVGTGSTELTAAFLLAILEHHLYGEMPNLGS